MIGKDVACFVLKAPCGIILALISQLILTVARPLGFLLKFLNAVLSAVMSYLFVVCNIVCSNVMHIFKTPQSKIILLLGEEEDGNLL